MPNAKQFRGAQMPTFFGSPTLQKILIVQVHKTRQRDNSLSVPLRGCAQFSVGGFNFQGFVFVFCFCFFHLFVPTGYTLVQGLGIVMESKNPRSLTEKDLKGHSCCRWPLVLMSCVGCMGEVLGRSSGRSVKKAWYVRKGDCRYSLIRKPTTDF